MSVALKLLQKKVGVEPDGAYGPNTARAITKHYGLDRVKAAHLLGQAGHESGGFKLTRENLNYSVEAMMRVWPSRFPDEDSAKPYARNGAKLASKVYVGRMGNETPEDAANFIGRGFLQLTGKDNYKSFAHDMRLPEVLTDPSLVEEDYAFETAMWFFDKNGLWKIADEGINDDAIAKITKRINGGHHGLKDRADRTRQAWDWLR